MSFLSIRTNLGTSHLHRAASEEKDEKGNSVNKLHFKKIIVCFSLVNCETDGLGYLSCEENGESGFSLYAAQRPQIFPPTIGVSLVLFLKPVRTGYNFEKTSCFAIADGALSSPSFADQMKNCATYKLLSPVERQVSFFFKCSQ